MPTVPALQTRRGKVSLENDGASRGPKEPCRAGAVAGVGLNLKYSRQVSTPRRRTSLVVAAVGGFLAHLAFPQASIWPLAMVGLAMLVWSLGRDSARWAFIVSTVWGVTHFLPLLWWAHEAVGPLPWVALSVAQAMMMAIGPVMFVWIRRIPALRNWQFLLSLPFAATWVVAEQIRHQWPFGGFPWVRIAFSQTDGPLLKLAPVGGAPLVGFVVAGLGALLAVGVSAAIAKDFVRVPLTALTIAVTLVGPMFIGLDARAESGTLRVGAVQGNVSNPGLDAFANAREVTGNHRDGTHRLSMEYDDLDLVLWPENASDYDPRVDAEAREMVNEAALAADAPLLVGTVRYTDDTRYNEIITWDGVDGEADTYAKQVPAAFAEYIPFRDFIRPIAPVVDLVSVDMSAGEEPAFLDVPIEALGRHVRTATIICFEVAYDWLVQDAVHHGAEFLYVPTNNATFGVTTESDQQLAMTRFRAVEHGRAAIQISTVGISGYASPDGRMHSVTGLFTAEEFAEEIPLRTSTTLATELGQWPIYGLMVLVGVLVVAGMVTYRVPAKHREQ